MKKIIVISILIFFQYYLILAVEADSTITAVHDSLNATNSELMKEKKDNDKWFYWTGVVGLGSTLSSTYGGWNAYWHDGPATLLGIELAFSSSRNFNIEIYNYLGFLKKNDIKIDYPAPWDGRIININNSNYLKLLSLAFGINFKLLSLMDNNRLNVIGNVDVPLFPFDKVQPCLIVGLGLKYRYNQLSTIALNYRATIKPPGIGLSYNVDKLPNLITLNYCYNF